MILVRLSARPFFVSLTPAAKRTIARWLRISFPTASTPTSVSRSISRGLHSMRPELCPRSRALLNQAKAPVAIAILYCIGLRRACICDSEAERAASSSNPQPRVFACSRCHRPQVLETTNGVAPHEHTAIEPPEIDRGVLDRKYSPSRKAMTVRYGRRTTCSLRSTPLKNDLKDALKFEVAIGAGI